MHSKLHVMYTRRKRGKKIESRGSNHEPPNDANMKRTWPFSINQLQTCFLAGIILGGEVESLFTSQPDEGNMSS